jgi:hypothetical protein
MLTDVSKSWLPHYEQDPERLVQALKPCQDGGEDDANQDYTQSLISAMIKGGLVIKVSAAAAAARPLLLLS